MVRTEKQNIQRHTETYRDIQRHTETYREIQRDTEPYRDIQKHRETYRDIQRHTETYRQSPQVGIIVKNIGGRRAGLRIQLQTLLAQGSF